MKQLKIGDFVLTRRSVHPQNNGLRCIVIECVQGRVIGGHPRPYTIVRLDGCEFPVLGTAPALGPGMRATCSAYYLKRLDLDGDDPRDKVLMGRDALADFFNAKAAAEAAIERAAEGVATKPRFGIEASSERLLKRDPRDRVYLGRDPASGFGGPHHRAHQRDQRLQRAIAAAKVAIDEARRTS